MKYDFDDIFKLNYKIDDNDTGVFYEEDDYAGLLRRVFAAMIDLSVIITFSTLFLVFIYSLNEKIPAKTNFIFLINISFIYLTFLKRSSYRTLGYFITGIKIVNLSGYKPSLYNMFLRIIILIFGTYDYSKSIDLIKTESFKQTLRDRYLGNYVVMVNAKPIGSGPIVTVAKQYSTRHIFKHRKVKKEEDVDIIVYEKEDSEIIVKNPVTARSDKSLWGSQPVETLLIMDLAPENELFYT
ncbi:MAG: RDD family protein [Desulfobacterales bacterium]|nr:RDD family protein [Desulfobacterales bacterium]